MVHTGENSTDFGHRTWKYQVGSMHEASFLLWRLVMENSHEYSYIDIYETYGLQNYKTIV